MSVSFYPPTARDRWLLGLLVLIALACAALLGNRLQAGPTEALGIPQVDPGGSHACAVTGNGEVLCWGWNFYGQLGDGTTESRFAPTATGLSDVSAVASGANHTCALGYDGHVRCWGLNDHGQLGDGTMEESRSTPGPPFLDEVRAIAAGTAHTCAVVGSFEISVDCWGDDSYGQLGDGTLAQPRPLPTVVCITAPCIPPNTISLAAGANHTCTLDTIEGIHCWGSNDFGQLGDGGACGDICASPVEVCLPASKGCIDPSDMVAITAGGAHTCALTTDRTLYCWGRNSDGQLGDGTTDDHAEPVKVCAASDKSCSPGSSLDAPVAVAAGLNHTCALSAAGAVSCWGLNSVGQLGHGAGPSSSLPVAVAGLPDDIISIAAGSSHTCTVTTSGTMQCWGWNADGRLGDGTFTGRDGPVSVLGFAPKNPDATSPSATPSAAPLTSTPTSTPVSATPSNTPLNATPTPSPPRLIGDANCDGLVTSVDAALTLQLVASLIPELQCSGVVLVDVNADGLVNSIDAALILQSVAGLLPAPTP